MVKYITSYINATVNQPELTQNRFFFLLQNTPESGSLLPHDQIREEILFPLLFRRFKCPLMLVFHWRKKLVDTGAERHRNARQFLHHKSHDSRDIGGGN